MRLWGVLFFVSAGAFAQTTVPEAARVDPIEVQDPPHDQVGPPREYGRLDFKVDPDSYSIISQVRGLSTHKSSYFYPLTYSNPYHGDESELIFQLSAKWRVFDTNFYIAYSQKSFWQWLNRSDSSPFRETNYDPELFYRWIPDASKWNHWGLDAGFEHESNGRGDFVSSRSWNRVYLAPFHAKGKTLAYLKFWYRIPDKDGPSSPTNPRGDENPEIVSYLGWSQFTLSRQIGGDQLISADLRASGRHGRGSVQINWSMPSGNDAVFWGASLFTGYGESLIDYNKSTTRLMLGIMLAR